MMSLPDDIDNYSSSIIDGEEADSEEVQPRTAKPTQHETHNDGLGELLVHQLIEVIEFVLGSISNTASYLRLWALSLAHSQLAEVFYVMLVEGFYTVDNIVVRVLGIALGFFVLMIVSGAVLMCMDLMECFLHALRLHW